MKLWWGIARVVGLAIGLLVTTTGIVAGRAEAKLHESLRGFGEVLTRLDGYSAQSAPRRLHLNGVELRVVTLTTTLEIDAALDRVENLCRTVEQLDLPATLRQKLDTNQVETTASPAGTIRKTASTEGYLGCIDLGSNSDAMELLARLEKFGTTLNLKELGQLRYVQARRSAGTTTLVVFWTEGDTKLAEIFPKTGDAPGIDLRGLPRPKAARRVLSSFEEGMPYAMASYVVEGSALKEVLRDYEAALDRNGWRRQVTRSGTLLAEKAGRRVVARFRERSPGRVSVSLSDLG